MAEESKKNIFISDLRKGENFYELFMVTSFVKRTKRDGNPYLSVLCSDKSGRIEGKVWNNVNQAESILKSGNIYRIKAFVNEYKGKKELRIEGINLIDEEKPGLNIDDFVETPKFDVDLIFDEMIFTLKSKVKEKYIIKLIDLFVEKYGARFKYHFGAQKIHHAYPGGLLKHTNSIIKTLIKLSEQYDIDIDVLLTGALFHDIGKIKEFSVTPSIEITEEGGLLGHIVLGNRIFDELTGDIEEFPRDVAIKIKHLIVSHHGEKEYGSPEIPKTQEALMLHLIDLLDSKFEIFEQNLNLYEGESSFTEYIPIIGRRLFKG